MDTNINERQNVYAFYKGVLTAFGPNWTAELRAWPEPRIEMLQQDGEIFRIHQDHEEWLAGLGNYVLWKGEQTSFWANDREDPKYIEERETNHKFMTGGLQPVAPPDDPEEQAIWRATFPSRFHLQLFWQTIPPAVRKALHGKGMRHWGALLILRHCPHALDLFDSNPMLFELLIDRYTSKHSAHSMPFDEIEAWMLRKQVDIMRHLGLPASESNRRILLKVTPETRPTFAMADILSKLEKHDWLHRIVEHLPRINTGVTHILDYHAPYRNISGPLLTEIGQLRDYDSMRVYFDVFNDTVDLLERAGMKDRRPRSIRSLQRLHDDMVRHLGPEALMTQKERGYVFPPPPYPGTEYIVPMTTPEELFREGMEMRHCGAIYAEKIADARCYCYRVLSPVRATLEMQRNEQGDWYIVQMSRKCNRSVGQEVIDKTWAALRASDPTADHDHASEAGLPEEYDPQLPLLTVEELSIFKKAVAAFSG